MLSQMCSHRNTVPSHWPTSENGATEMSNPQNICQLPVWLVKLDFVGKMSSFSQQDNFHHPTFLKDSTLCLVLWSNSAGTPPVSHPEAQYSAASSISGDMVVLIKHGIHNDSSSVLSTYISICRRLFSNLLHTGRSAMRKWSSQAAN